MQNNYSDSFESGNVSDINIKEIKLSKASDDNFFLKSNSDSELSHLKNDPIRKLNDYDYNLLQEDAYKDIKDDFFKLEYKISKIEEELALIESKIQAANDINDFNLIRELNIRKLTLLDNKKTLIETYNNKSLSARMSESLSNIISSNFLKHVEKIKKHTSYFSEKFLSKLPQNLSSIIELKKSLSKLENINRSVDELITINSPYGQNPEKYEQLSKYIIKANTIQAEISKFIK